MQNSSAARVRELGREDRGKGATAGDLPLENDGKLRRVITECLTSEFGWMADARLRHLLEELLRADNARRFDPFRQYLQFLIGLIGFSAVIIVGAVAAFPKDGTSPSAGLATALGGVLIWMTITALLAAVMTFIVQYGEYRFRLRGALDQRGEWEDVRGIWKLLLFCGCVLPLLSGTLAVLFCVRAGVSLIAAGHPHTLLMALWPF